MLTAETITDEQIREMLNSAWMTDRHEASVALHDNPHAIDYPTSTRRRGARARCAEILNARNGR